MNAERKTEIKVGLTALLGLILFIFIYGWAKNFTLNSDEQRMKIEFSTAAGLEIGDMVSLNGVRKGLVESIDIENNKAIVGIKFDEPVSLKKDAKFSIMMLDLMGGKKIEIAAGSSLEEIDYGKVQDGIFAGDISTAMATLSSVESDLIDVISELKLSLGKANSLFADENFSENIKKSVNNVERLTANLNQFILQNNETIRSTLENTKAISEKTNKFLENNEQEISSSISNLNQTLENSNYLVVEITKLIEEVKTSKNNIGKILYDEDLVNDLKSTLKEVKELTELINKQLKSEGLKVDADVDLF